MKITVPITIDVAKLKKNLKELCEETENLDIFLCVAMLDQIERGNVIASSEDNDCAVNESNDTPTGYKCCECIRNNEDINSPWCRTCYATYSGYGSNFERAASAAEKNESSATNSDDSGYGCGQCRYDGVDGEKCSCCTPSNNGYGSNFSQADDEDDDDDLTSQDKPEESPTAPICATCVHFDRQFPKTCKKCRENGYDHYERKEGCKFEL